MFSRKREHYIYIQIYAKRFICLKSDKTSPENCGVEIITDKDSSSFHLERTGVIVENLFKKEWLLMECRCEITFCERYSD